MQPKPVGSFSAVKSLLDLTDQQAERAETRDAQTNKLNIYMEIDFIKKKKKKSLLPADYSEIVL